MEIKQKTKNVTKLHLVPKITEDGQIIALRNQMLLLSLIEKNGWLRETELILLSGKDRQMVTRTVLKLELLGQINRRWCNNIQSRTVKVDAESSENNNQSKNQKSAQEKPKETSKETDYAEQKILGAALLRKKALDKKIAFNKGHFYGHFITLTRGGAKRLGVPHVQVDVPASTWRHTVGAIQSLHFLAHLLNQDEIITEKQILKSRTEKDTRKVPDGQILPLDCWFEFERAHKSGGTLNKQNDVVVRKAKEGTFVYLAYCYQANKIPDYSFIPNHELALTNSLCWLMGKPNHYVKFVRCLYKNELDYQRMRPLGFEVIDMPEMKLEDFNKKIDMSVKSKKPLIIDQVDGWGWKPSKDIVIDFEIWHLYYAGQLLHEFKFVPLNDYSETEGNAENELWIFHQNQWVRAISIEQELTDEERTLTNFSTYIDIAKLKAVKKIVNLKAEHRQTTQQQVTVNSPVQSDQNMPIEEIEFE